MLAQADAPAEAGRRVRGPASSGAGQGAAGAVLLPLVGLAARLTGRGRRSWGRTSGWMRWATLLGLLPLALLSATCAGSSWLGHDGTPIDIWPASASLDLTDRQHSVVASVDAVGAVVTDGSPVKREGEALDDLNGPGGVPQRAGASCRMTRRNLRCPYL
jgi:hypothetical protein